MGFGKNGEEGFRGSNFKLQLQVGEEETRKRDMDSENNGEKVLGCEFFKLGRGWKQFGPLMLHCFSGSPNYLIKAQSKYPGHL